jgi:hypothetical protein
MKACQPVWTWKGQLSILFEMQDMFSTESSEPASSVAEYVLNTRRRKLGYPADCQYNKEDASITRYLTNDIVLQLSETFEGVSILVTVIATIREVLHGSHLGHRSRCDHREDPCRDVNVSQTLSIGKR